MTETGAAAGAAGAPRAARQPETEPEDQRGTDAEGEAMGHEYLMLISWHDYYSGSPAESPVQAELDLRARPVDPVFQGDGEGAVGERPEEALPPGREIVRGAAGRPSPGPLLDRFRQRPPQAQFQLEPRVPRPAPQYRG